MSLTSAQLATLKAAILADTDPAVIAARSIRNDTEVARLYNLASSPAFIVWKTAVPPEDYRESVVWTEVDTLTVGKARIWEWLTGLMALPFNPSKANVRTGIADCWAVGTTTRTQLLALAKRTATKAEKLYATGTGTDATPGTLTFEGALGFMDVAEALNLP